MVINDQYAREPDRFRLACDWAVLARNISHPTTLTAYKSAMSLMQKSFSFAPTVSVQHARLVAMGENCQTMPLDYASYLINLGQFDEAVETLEQGRALLWSEMRGLRTPITTYRRRLAVGKEICRDQSRTRGTDHICHAEWKARKGEDVVTEDGTDPFGRLVVKRQRAGGASEMR
jgi:hypothetical protein